MNDEVQALDRPWGAEKIRIFLWGDAVVSALDLDGKVYDLPVEGQTLFEMRCRAYDSGESDMILEPAQFEMAARTVRDRVTQSLLLLKARTGLWHGGNCISDHAADLMGDKRAGRNLLNRGADLIRREERTRHTIRINMGRAGDSPVCWRCMKERVSTAGDDCGCDPDGRPARQRGLLRGTRYKGHLKNPYDPSVRPSPRLMTQEERDAEIAHLVDTQEDDQGPGGEMYRKHVVPYGSDPDEITAKSYVRWAPLGSDLPPPLGPGRARYRMDNAPETAEQ
jgi:hypothetical protein